jgi:hypothetical protein
MSEVKAMFSTTDMAKKKFFSWIKVWSQHCEYFLFVFLGNLNITN